MNSQVDVFISLCRRYLDGKLCTNDYIFAFEELYIKSEATLSEREYVVFDDIYATNDRFEPNGKIRRSDSYLIDKTELQRLIQKGVSELVE